MEHSPDATAYDSWADHYDLTDADRSGFIEFYSGLLDARTRSILELGCGTGTIASALSQRLDDPDARVVGIDASNGMLRVARERDPSIEWIFGDIRKPPVAGDFDLVFCCFNTLQHLLTDEDLAQAFVAARDLLSPRGVYAFDIYQPNEAYLRIPQSNRLARTVVDKTGRRLEIREDTTYEPATQVLSLQWRLVDAGDPASAPLAHTGYRLRQHFAADVERLLADSGLAILDRYGDFDRSPFGPQSKKQIVVCQRR